MNHLAKRRRTATLVIAGQSTKLDAPGFKAMKRIDRIDLYWVAASHRFAAAP